ncbi:V0D/AC39 family V-type ATPase subunit [Jiangella muralis]|uniref:V0D/AC39 family V-type ATPase subunit n=1 Tax=Jiangella muralis TaxID=702383 RepID=UPI00069DB648|nr:V-type ATPase subunit [Jiangella muralis]
MTAPLYVAGSTALRARMSRLTPHGAGEEERDELRRLLELFVGEARTVAQVLTGRHDLRDALALLRGAASGLPPEDRLRGLLAVGALTPERAAELAHARDEAGVAALLERLRLPTPATAAALPRLWSRFELHRDVEELELALAATAHAEWAERAAHPRSRPVAELLARERDQRNLVIALARSDVDPARLLPFGRLGARDLEHAVAGRWAPVLGVHPRWRAAAAAYEVHRDLGHLDRDLHDEATAGAAARLRRGDAESADPLVGYLLLLEERARRHRRAVLVLAGGADRRTP